MTGTLGLPDGRTLAWEECGDPGGYPVVGLHGTPGCRLARWVDHDVYARAGVRLLMADRPGSVDELLWALDGAPRLPAELPARRTEMERSVAGDVGDLLGPETGEADRAYLARPGLRPHLARNVAEAVRPGVDGWVDDSVAFARPWGFEPRGVQVPLLLLLYGLEDHTLPVAHSRWLEEHVPVTHVVVDADGGHLPTDPEREVAEVMGWLARGEAPARART